MVSDARHQLPWRLIQPLLLSFLLWRFGNSRCPNDSRSLSLVPRLECLWQLAHSDSRWRFGPACYGTAERGYRFMVWDEIKVPPGWKWCSICVNFFKILSKICCSNFQLFISTFSSRSVSCSDINLTSLEKGGRLHGCGSQHLHITLYLETKAIERRRRSICIFTCSSYKMIIHLWLNLSVRFDMAVCNNV